jgi:hypothetical protein
MSISAWMMLPVPARWESPWPIQRQATQEASDRGAP